MKISLSFFAVLLLLVFADGCSSDDSPTDGGNTDTKAPEIASVNAIDVRQLQLTFTEEVNKATAEHDDNYVIVEQNPPPVSPAMASPGDTVGIASVILGADKKTVTISTWQDMGSNPYEISVTGVEDVHGNRIRTTVSQDFTGSNANDTTPPSIVMRSPAPGSNNAGIGESVVVQFSEPMNYTTVGDAFQWTRQGGAVSWSYDEEGANTYVFTATEALMNGEAYTVSVGSGAMDWAGNSLAGAPVTWGFTTTSTIDNTPPTLVSSTPTNGSANVSVTTNLVLTFSEAVNQASLEEVLISPEISDGVIVWSNSGRTLTFDPDIDLMANTQYALVIIPGALLDLAGNGNASLIQIVWSTGATLASGGIRGTLAGDPLSAAASDPTGATVVAATSNPFAGNDDFEIGGSATVAANDTYAITNLPDAWYFPLSVMDSNGDGKVDPSTGDAIALFGVDFTSDFDADSVQVVSGQTMTGIDFGLYDPVAILGSVNYTGAMIGGYPYWVGAFDTTGFDINNLPDPDFGTDEFWPNRPDYLIAELDEGLQPGTYYVGAYLDVNFNDQFDPGVDPAGFYGGLSNPTPLTLAHGDDAFDINITMVDPAARSAAPPVSWSQRTVDPRRQALARQIRRALEMQRE